MTQENTQPQRPAPAPAPGSETTDQLLRRIVVAVESNRRGRLEVVMAIVLSLATLCSTWCGYQASQWNGKSSSVGDAADTAEREAAENTIVALQLRTQDGLLLLEYWKAARSGDAKTAELARSRLPSRARVALDAAVAAGALENPDAPGPLHRAEYVIPEEQAAKRQREECKRWRDEANAAGDVGASYVLLTLVFASVLFFGGITGTFSARRIRLVLGVLALAIFAVAVAKMLGLPRSIG